MYEPHLACKLGTNQECSRLEKCSHTQRKEVTSMQNAKSSLMHKWEKKPAFALWMETMLQSICESKDAVTPGYLLEFFVP